MKKVLLVIISAIVSLSLISIPGAESSIMNNMQFSENKISITIDQAIDKVLKDNSTVKNSLVAIEQSKINSEKISDTERKIRKSGSVTTGSRTELEIKIRDLATTYLLQNANNNLEVSKNIVKAEVEQAYYGLLQAKELYEINKKNVEIAQNLLDKSNQKFSLGIIARQEVIDSELNLIKAKSQLTSAENQLNSSKMTFNVKLGYDVMANIEPYGQLSFKEEKMDDLAKSINLAFSSRNEITAAKYALDYAKLKMRIVQATKAEMTYDYRAQLLSVEEAEKDYSDSFKNVEMDIRNKYMAITNKLEAIKSGQKAVQLAEEALKISTLSYDTGMSVLTDVQKAQNALLQARLSLSQSILDYNLAVSQYKDSEVIGRTEVPSAISSEVYSVPTDLLF